MVTFNSSPPPTECFVNFKGGTNRTKSKSILGSKHPEGSTDLDINNWEAWMECSLFLTSNSYEELKNDMNSPLVQ